MPEKSRPSRLRQLLPAIIKILKIGALTAAAALFLLGTLYLFGMGFLPNLDGVPFSGDEASLAAIENDRDVVFDPDDPVVLHRNVDYSLGTDAAWYPKGESPFLAELVEEGKLPPVAERVGPEPVVMEGVEGVGRYGGTWYRVSPSEEDAIRWTRRRLAGALLARWSPLGYPIRPHVAKSWEASEDQRRFTVHLRKGARWSDGHPFTADDILYWWENEALHFGQRPPMMEIRGELGDIEKVGDYTLQFTYPHPVGLFAERLAQYSFWAPAHYLKPFHPDLGDPEKAEAMRQLQGVASTRVGYFRLKDFRNPEHPRLWPWVPRSHQTIPPILFVRNPYYYAVDVEGNQLPYLDRVLFDVRSEDMIAVTAASGDISMQLQNLRYEDYTLYMEEATRNGFQVYHWYPAYRSAFAVYPNLNFRVDPEKPETKWKHAFLNEKKFRKALSLAIDREEIIEAEYHGRTEPAQIDPGPESPFHHPPLFKSFVAHDPERARALLDEIGLDRRDGEGFRTFPDGTRMTWFLYVTDYTGTGPSQFLIEDWAEVGVRVVLREMARSLWQRLQSSQRHDFSVWTGASEFYPLIEPRNFVPVHMHSFYAPGFAAWHRLGGLYGRPEAEETPLAVEPPEGHPLRRSMEVLDAARAAFGIAEQRRIFEEALDIAADNVWSINISTPPPQLVVVENGFRNVPKNAITGNAFISPANAGIETYFYEDARDSAGAVAQMKRLALEPEPDPRLSLQAAIGEPEAPGAGERLGALIRYLVYGVLLAGAVMVAVRHPFVGRRFLILVPTLLAISVATFVIIQAPPGNYIEARIAELEMEGDEAALQQIRELREIFHLEEPMAMRYLRWMGIPWFFSFEEEDRGLLQGSLGRSMEDTRLVNEIVGDRLLLTFLISLFTVLFTWAMALPIGVYSAVRQYSFGDYAFTLLGFIGMCIPNFLLALVLMHVSSAVFDAPVSGLFSPEYAAQPGWSWGKFADLLQHVWVPVVVIGTAGTAGMIRVMRANLLDELRKPYVVTARAKGVRPLRLLLKYPVRLALNPFVSGIGGLFPQLVSGGAIVAIVLSLPTVGPLLLNALMAQDMFLAGSLLMVLSLLSVLGTLVSDLLLMWIDPRIRMGKA